MEVLERFVSGYNDMGHSKTGMAPSLVTGKDVLRIWERMRKWPVKIRRTKATGVSSMGQTLRFSKEMMRLARRLEHN